MSRKQVVEIACSRCERTEHRAEGDTTKLPTVFKAMLQSDVTAMDMVVAFDDLCTPCLRTVRALLSQIGKHIEGVSPDRGIIRGEAAAKKGDAATPPVKEGSDSTEPVQHHHAPSPKDKLPKPAGRGE